VSHGSRDADVLVVLCTIPPDRARPFAESLVEARLAACVNVLPTMRSIYRWKGEIASDDECQLVIKTTRDRWDALSQFVKQHHGYEVPELLAVDVTRAPPEYSSWLRGQTREEPPIS
jgi:periplasmic divalent cation tolerance protein